MTKGSFPPTRFHLRSTPPPCLAWTRALISPLLTLVIHPTNSAHLSAAISLGYNMESIESCQTLRIFFKRGFFLRTVPFDRRGKPYVGVRLNSMRHSSSLPTNSSNREDHYGPKMNWNMMTQAMVPTTACNFLEVVRMGLGGRHPLRLTGTTTSKNIKEMTTPQTNPGSCDLLV